MSDDVRCLRFAVGPASILIAALVLFQASAFDAPGFSATVASAIADSFANAPASVDLVQPALQTRVLWTASALLFLASAAATAVLAIVILRDLAHRPAQRVLYVVVLAMVAMQIVAGVGNVAPAFENLHRMTVGALHALPGGEQRFAAMIRAAFTVNFVAAIIPALGLVAGCACTLPRSGAEASELDDIQTRMRRLDNLLHIGSAMLATGVLHLLAWMRIPANLPGIDAGLAAEIQTHASTFSLFWGAAYSALIAAWYLPASRALAAEARAALARERKQLSADDAEEWLRKRGLAISPLQRVPQMIAMLGPLVVGPAGTLLIDMAKAVG